MVSDTPERLEFMLAALRVASMRAKLYEIEINSIGVALKGGLIDCYGAMEWLKEIGALGLTKILHDVADICPSCVDIE